MKTSNSSTTVTKAVYADLRNDFMFKKAFSQKDIMIPFLNDILETDKIQDIVYRNVEQLGFDAESPEPKQPFAFRYRLFPVYIISITEFALEHEAGWPDERFVSRYSVRENATGELYCETLNYVFVELPRFRKALQQKSAGAEKWAYVFNNITKLKEVPGELSEKYFRKLFESAKIANFTGEEQLSYIESEKMKYDYENCIEYAEEKGLEEGLAKGREEGEAKGREEGEAKGKAEIAKNLLAKGLDTLFISEVTGLSVMEIEKLSGWSRDNTADAK